MNRQPTLDGSRGGLDIGLCCVLRKELNGVAANDGVAANIFREPCRYARVCESYVFYSPCVKNPHQKHNVGGSWIRSTRSICTRPRCLWMVVARQKERAR